MISELDRDFSVELSVVMPCLNEAETLAACIRQIKRTFEANHIPGEVIIADNGSTDGSVEIAVREGARVVPVSQRGYGSAIDGGVKSALGEYIIMGDADSSYNFEEIPVLLTQLRKGYELVMGNRFKGGVKKGAMPFLHRYLGNPVLSFFGRLFYNIPIGDFHCGLRGFNRKAYLTWGLKTTGMEFASEMVVKAALKKAHIAEVPVTLSPDGRSRPPHLRTWQDGWRHLQFLLIHSPRWLFAIPGFSLFVFGLILMVLVLPSPIQIGRFGLDVHTLLLGMTMVVAGFQALSLGIVSRIYAIKLGTKQPNNWTNFFTNGRIINTMIFLGAGLVLLGSFGFVYSFIRWEKQSFGGLDPSRMIRVLVPFMLSFLMGFQLIIVSFFISLVNLERINLVQQIVTPEANSSAESTVYS
ncbi:glycosyltransferase [Nibrella viscosa]|uniref:Glycosyltransferase n=1 Tax=Nibrella viscosa TaxID=1084524 RepID=A0ABP8KIY0_9BACT